MAARQIRKSPPPPPLDERRYDGHAEWNNKRWAWEFLCRNVKFREACDALAHDATPRQRRAIAKKFHLARFKHYNDPYESDDGTSPPPMFRSKAVVPIRPKRSDDKSWFQPVNIRPGQIAIRFDLGLAVQDDLILKGQIDAAAAVLERQLSKFRKAKGISEKAGRNRKRAQVLLQLRILDALAIEATHAHHANLVWGPDTSEKKFVDAMKSALDMAQEGYLSLAAIGNKVPTVK